MPLTASSPIEPPGKRSGLTTKLSVVNASRRAADVELGGVAQRLQERTAEERREQPLDEAPAGLAAGAVGHLDLRVAEADRSGGESAMLKRRRLSAAPLRCT